MKKRKGASSKPPQAASEKEVKPFQSRHATYKEVLEGWKDKEKRLEGGHSTDGEWQVVQRPRSKKRHWQLKAAKPKSGYIPVGSDSSSSTPAAKASKPEPLKKVAIDWHNVIQLTSPQRGDYIPNSHIRAIWDMQSNGFQVVVISYCFAKRAASVLHQISIAPLVTIFPDPAMFLIPGLNRVHFQVLVFCFSANPDIVIYQPFAPFLSCQLGFSLPPSFFCGGDDFVKPHRQGSPRPDLRIWGLRGLSL